MVLSSYRKSMWKILFFIYFCLIFFSLMQNFLYFYDLSFVLSQNLFLSVNITTNVVFFWLFLSWYKKLDCIIFNHANPNKFFYSNIFVYRRASLFLSIYELRAWFIKHLSKIFCYLGKPDVISDLKLYFFLILWAEKAQVNFLLSVLLGHFLPI